MDDSRTYLDPKTLARIEGLELKARLIVEGYLAGLHKSPFRGFSVEFAQHREYAPGDDIKHVDWKVWSRTDKYYLKQYEQDTDLVCYLLVDASESMRYGSDGMSKYDYGCHLAAALAYLVLHQRDSVGLATFDHQLRDFVRPSGNPAHLKQVTHLLETTRPDGRTGLGPVFHDLAERLTKRGLVVIVSDLFDTVEAILGGLKHFRHRRHDVIVFHVLDAQELTFPFQEPTLFKGLEGLPELLAEPRALRRAYLAALEDYLAAVRSGCRLQQVDYLLVDTSQALDVVLSSYLAARRRRLKG